MQRLHTVVLLVSIALGAAALAQAPASKVVTLEVSPAALTLEVGQKAALSATARAQDGAVVEVPIVFYSRARRSVAVNSAGQIEAHRAGTFTVVALVPKAPPERSTAQPAEPPGGIPETVIPTREPVDPVVSVEIPVTVVAPPVVRLNFVDGPPRLYADTDVRLRVVPVDRLGDERTDVRVSFVTSDPAVATIDSVGFLKLLRSGTVRVTAQAEGVSELLSISVDPNPVTSLELDAAADTARTGDVVRFTAVARDARGEAVRDAPVEFAVFGEPSRDILGAGAAAHITEDGRFVAERSGIYRVMAVAGRHSASETIQVTPREVQRQIELVGRGPVLDRHTSDLWVWEGTDGRDYAITGTWGADGRAYIWDVTDPTRIQRVQEIQVDARTINDVKVSEDGTVAVLGREGASNRRNGIVILGVATPREGVPVLAEFSDQLTGGVHNTFIADNHIFALSAGRRYDIINIEDPRQPRRVGRFELDTPNHAIHDVWVRDGVVFSSNWSDGVVAVDVGGGGKGGSPSRPVKLGAYRYPSGWNHAAFPYRSQSTGKVYLFAGDEAFPFGGYEPDQGTTPTRAAGWIHIVEWDDWDHPREVARYQVPEAGSHDLWVEDDILHVAYYNGGLRLVDVSGELLGDLYRQGREIASFVPYDPKGFIANAPFVWGPQPYKGNIFFTDWNTGLWVVRLGRSRRAAAENGEPQ